MPAHSGSPLDMTAAAQKGGATAAETPQRKGGGAKVAKARRAAYNGGGGHKHARRLQRMVDADGKVDGEGVRDSHSSTTARSHPHMGVRLREPPGIILA